MRLIVFILANHLALCCFASNILAPPRLVTRAYSADGGAVCTDLPAGFVDWEAIARRQLGTKVVERPDSQRLEKHHSEPAGDSFLTFHASAPAAVTNLPLIVLGASGWKRGKFTELRGTVAYEVDHRSEITKRQVYGRACTEENRGIERAAFAVLAFSAETLPAPENAAVITIGDVKHQFDRPALAGPGTPTTLMVRVNRETTYLLLSWRPGFCESIFSLYDIGGENAVELVGENGYDCDV
jgi:hypothetical protein